MLKKLKLEVIRKWYPNAVTTIDGVNMVIDFLENRLELELDQIMFADSICSDDVNSIQYPSRIHEFLGPFKMGGLDGYPFTGITGMRALASHVPDSGAVYIYYGPHIGISKSGKIGEILRYGQTNTSSCCGAAKGALTKLMNLEIVEGSITDLDYQMNYIEQILFRQRNRVLESNIPFFEATEVIYEEIDSRINTLIENTNFNCKYVILVGAILINSDLDMGSFSSTKRFDVIDITTNERKSYLKEF